MTVVPLFLYVTWWSIVLADTYDCYVETGRVLGGSLLALLEGSQEDCCRFCVEQTTPECEFWTYSKQSNICTLFSGMYEFDTSSSQGSRNWFYGNRPTQETGDDLRCNLPQDIGPCDGLFERYWFNAAKEECELFWFGGCGGNENNFESIEDCERACFPHQNCPPREDWLTIERDPDDCIDLEIRCEPGYTPWFGETCGCGCKPSGGPLCCDPLLEPGTAGNPICVDGHACCETGQWQCSDGDGVTFQCGDTHDLICGDCPREPGWTVVQQNSESCKLLLFVCENGWMPWFEDKCGCGCRPAEPLCCDPALEPGQNGNPFCSDGYACCTTGKWQCSIGNGVAFPCGDTHDLTCDENCPPEDDWATISSDPEQCEDMSFICEARSTRWSDEMCGCGCKPSSRQGRSEGEHSHSEFDDGECSVCCVSDSGSCRRPNGRGACSRAFPETIENSKCVDGECSTCSTDSQDSLSQRSEAGPVCDDLPCSECVCVDGCGAETCVWAWTDFPVDGFCVSWPCETQSCQDATHYDDDLGTCEFS